MRRGSVLERMGPGARLLWSLAFERRMARFFRERRDVAPGCVACRRKFHLEGGAGPMHDASGSCRSGKRNHCSCDACY